jgi:dihydrofolate synthase/folylpolyglutamate synthase
MDYKSVLEDLEAIEKRGICLGLENTCKILDRLPTAGIVNSSRFLFIQVAGTNGKGSTAYFLTSILQAAGYTVGLFTSPHLQDVRERIAINQRWISEEDFTASYRAVKELSHRLFEKGLIDHMPTYFEQLFLTAIHYFSSGPKTPDIIILEVGLGGRLDATSVITPAISVITTISQDHTAMLGSRLKDIAAEKAGIIKKGVPVVCGCRVGSTAHRVIKEIARRNHAPFFNVVDAGSDLQIHQNGNFYHCTYTTESQTYTFDLHLNGAHQAYNAAAAIKTLQVLQHTTPLPISISRRRIDEGISETAIPARIESLKTTPRVILDGGHNVESIAALTHFLNEKKKRDLTLIFGVLADKNYRKMIILLLPHIKNVILTEPLSGRALPAARMIKLFKVNYNPKPLSPSPPFHIDTVLIKNNLEEAYAAARQFNREILITGSFYLVGAMRKIIIQANNYTLYPEDRGRWVGG